MSKAFFFNLISSLEWCHISPSLYCQTCPRSSWQSLHSLTSHYCPVRTNWILTDSSLRVPSRRSLEASTFKLMDLTFFSYIKGPNLSFLLKFSPLLVLVILLQLILKPTSLVIFLTHPSCYDSRFRRWLLFSTLVPKPFYLQCHFEWWNMKWHIYRD